MMLRLSVEEKAELVRRAGEGDRLAWARIVDEHVNLVWTIAVNHGLGRDDAGDVVQTTWLRLLEHINRLRQPERLGAWLATTARREALRVSAQVRRYADWPDNDDRSVQLAQQSPTDHLEQVETSRALLRAFGRLSPRCQSLLRLLLLDPPPSYVDIALALNIAVGSIGPTRARCLAALREELLAEGVHGADMT